MGRLITLKPTEPLDVDRHDRAGFSCGVESLDRYLKEQARKEGQKNIAQTFVLCGVEEPDRILGYYTLSANRVLVGDLPAELTKRLPRYDSIGVTLLGRFAIAQNVQRSEMGLGAHLLADAKLKVWEASRVVASFALIVDVLAGEKGDPTSFYLKYDFCRFPESHNKLYLPMTTIEGTLRKYGLI